jgi:hypothetical protein
VPPSLRRRPRSLSTQRRARASAAGGPAGSGRHSVRADRGSSWVGCARAPARGRGGARGERGARCAVALLLSHLFLCSSRSLARSQGFSGAREGVSLGSTPIERWEGRSVWCVVVERGGGRHQEGSCLSLSPLSPLPPLPRPSSSQAILCLSCPERASERETYTTLLLYLLPNKRNETT